MNENADMIEPIITLKPLLSVSITAGGLGTWLLSMIKVIHPILGCIAAILVIIYWLYGIKKRKSEFEITELQRKHLIKKYDKDKKHIEEHYDVSMKKLDKKFEKDKKH